MLVSHKWRKKEWNGAGRFSIRILHSMNGVISGFIANVPVGTEMAMDMCIYFIAKLHTQPRTLAIKLLKMVINVTEKVHRKWQCLHMVKCERKSRRWCDSA